MLTKELSQAYDSLPDAVKSAILALSILIDRIGSLPKADRDDLFELLQEWRKADDPEEQRSIRRAMEEVLAQLPVNAKPLSCADGQPMSRGLKAWTEHVGRKIRELRERAGLTQARLAEKAGIPQSHVSRLENAEHSATHMTLERIAKALGVSVGDIDPCID
jgi:DNA-binding XRE family transcriptional regulator